MALCVIVPSSVFSNEKTTKITPQVNKVTFVISGEIGRSDFNCEKISLQCLNLDIISEEVIEKTIAPAGSITATFELISDGELLFTFSLPNEPFEEKIYVPQNINLSQSISRALGVSSMVIQKGEYPNRKNIDGTITAKIKVTSK